MAKYLTAEEKNEIVGAEIERLRQKRKNKHTWEETPLCLPLPVLSVGALTEWKN